MRDSVSSPLRIAEAAVPDCSGLIGMTICPGKKDADVGWDRELHADIAAIRDWGASTVVTLIEAHEFVLLGVERLPDVVRDAGMDWIHLPIRDVDVPDQRFESSWPSRGATLHERLNAGERILIHCRGGLGRTGLVAAVILAERGMPADGAIRAIRTARHGAIETQAQERYVINRVFAGFPDSRTP